MIFSEALGGKILKFPFVGTTTPVLYQFVNAGARFRTIMGLFGDGFSVR